MLIIVNHSDGRSLFLSGLVLSLALSYFLIRLLLSLSLLRFGARLGRLWWQTASCLHYNAFIYSCVCGQWQPCLCTVFLSVCILRDIAHFHFSLSFCSHHSFFSVKCCFQLTSKLTRECTTCIGHIQRPTSAHRGFGSTFGGRIALRTQLVWARFPHDHFWEASTGCLFRSVYK